MRKSRFMDEQIIAVVQEDEAGADERSVRRHGISVHTFYRWRNKFGGTQVDEARRLRQLEEENRRLKRIVADQA